MKELYDQKSWLAIRGGSVPHAIFKVAGVNHYAIEPDELHIIFLGVLQYMIGSVLWLLVFRILERSPKENLDRIWSKIIEYYRGHAVSVQYSSLSISSFCSESSPDSHYPRLKGKGAELRDVLAPTAEAWSTLVPDDYDMKADIFELLKRQLHCQDILHDYRHDYFLPVPEVNALRAHIGAGLLLYQKLAARADRDAELLFSQPTKFHWMWHLGERAMYLSPRLSNTMMDEDFVGRMKELVQACSAGTELDNMALKAIEKYRYGFDFISKWR